MEITSLYSMVKSKLDVEEHSENFVYAYAESVLYLTGATQAFAFQEYMKRFCVKQSAKVYRLKLQAQKYTNLDLKLFAFRLALTKQAERREKAMELAAELSIARNDAKMICILLEETPWFRTALGKAARKCGRRNPFLHFANIDKLFHAIYPSILKYIKFLTYRKLRFLVKHDNRSFEGLHSDLTIKVLQAFYSLVPSNMEPMHIVNYLKRVVHNHTVNIIKSQTSKKRGRLVKIGVDKNNENQFSLLCVSQNQVAVKLDADGEEVDLLNVEDEASSKFETSYAISEVLDSVKASKKKYRFLTLLLGQEDEEFTHWLRLEKHCKPSEDNVDVQSRIPVRTFNELIADFLNVSYRKLESFLSSVKQMVTA